MRNGKSSRTRLPFRPCLLYGDHAIKAGHLTLLLGGRYTSIYIVVPSRNCSRAPKSAMCREREGGDLTEYDRGLSNFGGHKFVMNCYRFLERNMASMCILY
jgi:hypothetical protein